MKDEDWRLGDLNHSRPAIAVYGLGDKTAAYIFVGSNDGMLHCFNDDDGEEAWAFIPREQFDRLRELVSGRHAYFMDGSPSIAAKSDLKSFFWNGSSLFSAS